MEYAVVFEKAERNWSAYVPDLPGCIATGRTLEQTKRDIATAIRMHLVSMAEHGEVIPGPMSECSYVHVADVASTTRSGA